MQKSNQYYTPDKRRLAWERDYLTRPPRLEGGPRNKHEMRRDKMMKWDRTKRA